MPATITATNNPVPVPNGQPSGSTDIIWNGAEQGNCILFESINGVQDVQRDPPPPNILGNNQGNYKAQIIVGSTHVFRLKRALINSVVASLTVTAKHPPGPWDESLLSSVEDGLLHVTAIPVQAITRVTVSPQADHAVFMFRTIVATVPIVTITIDDADPGTLLTSRFPIFGGARTEHLISVDGLPQGATLFFKIAAGNPMLWSSPPAVLRGSFRTGRADAEIIFDRILVHSDSDTLSEGDLTFKFFAGDAQTRSGFPVAMPVHQEGLSDGETAFVGKSIHIQKVPPRLWVDVQCEDDDFLAFPLGGIYPVGHPPGEGSISGFYSNPHRDVAWVWSEFDTLESGVVHQGVRETPFSMKTGNFPLAFEVFGRLRVTGFRGLGFRTDPTIPFNVGAAFGQLILKALSSDGKTMMAALGPDGAVYYKSIGSDGPVPPGNEWIGLGGKFAGLITGVAGAEGHIELFALDADGAPSYKSYADGEPPGGEWRRLDGAFVGCLTAIRGPRNRIELFGVDREGTVHHRVVEPRGRDVRGDWERLGGRAAGPLAPVYSPRTGLGLFALGRDGSVLHKHRDKQDWQPGPARWDSLGGKFTGTLGATLMDDGSVMLVVIGGDRMLYTLIWKNYPEDRPAGRWEAAGTLDSLFESLALDPGRSRLLVPERRTVTADDTDGVPSPRPRPSSRGKASSRKTKTARAKA